MDSTLLESPQLPVAKAEDQQLTFWPALAVAEKAFVAAYIKNTYSLREACGELGISTVVGKKYLQKNDVSKAIAEVQHDLDNIDYLNERWVKAQLMRLYPMTIGDEPVPIVTNTGEEIMANKFYPEVAMKIIEYVAPKAHRSVVDVSITNITKLSDEQLEAIAAKGMGRVVSEQ